jgi:hypothetical protein
MAAFLADEAKAGGEKNAFLDLPVNWCYPWHPQTPTAAECLSVATQAGLTQRSSCNS